MAKKMRWRYRNGKMIWETPLCTYSVYPLKVEGEILYVLEYSDLGLDYFYERKDAVGSAEKDYEHRVRNIINEI